MLQSKHKRRKHDMFSTIEKYSGVDKKMKHLAQF